MTSIDLNNFTAIGYTDTSLQKTEGAKLQQMASEYANPKDKSRKQMKDVAQQFESIFVKQLMDEMDKTVDRDDDGMLGGGSAEGYFRDMMYQQMSTAMSTRSGGSGLGLAEMVYRQMAQQLPPDSSSSANAVNGVDSKNTNSKAVNNNEVKG